MTDSLAADETAAPVPFSALIGADRSKTEITLNGERIERSVTGLTIDCDSRDPFPTVVLRLNHRATPAQFDGLARVVVEDVITEPGPAAAVFLSAIDAEELERAALNRLDLDNGPGGLTKTMLRQLIEWAHGRT